MTKRSFFVTGTDTGVGKTVFTGLLAKYCLDLGQSVVTQKWVQTGDDRDIESHLELMGRSWEDYKGMKSAMVPYTFALPASAHLAAEQEGAVIQTARIQTAFEALKKRFDIVIAEGSGGVHVPLSRQFSTLDLLEQLKVPCILVVANKLGAINHTLLTIDVLLNRRIPIEGFVMNHYGSSKDLVTEDNPKVISDYSGVAFLGEMKDGALVNFSL